MRAYYNEYDKFTAAWLRELIKADVIAPGDVDERSIEDVLPNDLRPYTQHHFFAGIGVWPYALRRLGWPDNRPIWTGSCPCQPFSAAGKGGGFTDERHLWPSWCYLIGQLEPIRIVGEQVSNKSVEPWVNLVQTDLEGMAYAFGCVAFPSAGVGAPHIRDRAYWVAHATRRGSGAGFCSSESSEQRRYELANHGATSCAVEQPGGGRRERGQAAESGYYNDGEAPERQENQHGTCIASPYRSNTARGMEYAASDGREQWRAESSGRSVIGGCSPSGVALGDADATRPQGRSVLRTVGERGGNNGFAIGASGATSGFWNPCDWLPCIDGKARPVEPGTFPLVNGASARVGRLRGYGNALNAEAAIEFLKAALYE